MEYYTPLIVLIWLTLLVLIIIVKENARFTKTKKKILYITYIIVAIAAFFEWLGLQLNGNMNIPGWLIKFVKIFDYILTPIAGGSIIFQFQRRSICRSFVLLVLLINAFFQIIAVFTDWMIIIDSNNIYSHGPAFNAYLAINFIIIVLICIEFTFYGRKFRKHNSISLYATMILVVTGILMQELLEVRTAYIALTVGLLLLFIQDAEFAQLASDDLINEQLIRISEDPLTGISSRYAYTSAINALKELNHLPKRLVAFSIDVNGLKTINDTLGHHAGDELIQGAASCIFNTFHEHGKCYRTGGDEFIVLSTVGKEEAIILKKELEEAVRNWHGEEAPSLSLSSGFAIAEENPGVNIEKLVAIADSEMYKEKNEYHKEKKDR